MHSQGKTSIIAAAMGASLGLVAFGCANTAEDCALIGMCGGKDAPSAGGMGGAGGAVEMGGAGGSGGTAAVCKESLQAPSAANTQSAENVHITPQGTLVVTGNFVGEFALGPSMPITSDGPNPAFFLARYEADLTLDKVLGVKALLLDSAMDTQGNLLAVGTHAGTVTLPDGCPALPDTSGLFVVKIDTTDKCVWAKSYTLAQGTELTAHVAVGAKGDIAVAGAFSGSIDGLAPGGTLTSVGTKDIFLAKLNAGGDSLWGGRYGEAGQTQEAHAVAMDSSGNVVFAGDYDGTLNLNDGSIQLKKYENHVGFAANVSSNGMNVRWQTTFALDSGTQHVTAMALNGSNEVVVAGDINGTWTANKLDTTHRLFLAKLSLADGAITLVKGYGGSGAPKIHDIALAANEQIALTGHLDEKLDLGDGERGAEMPGERFFWSIVDEKGTNARSSSAGDDITGEKRGLGLAVNTTHAFVVGHFEGAMHIAGQLRTSGGDQDMFVAGLCLPE